MLFFQTRASSWRQGSNTLCGEPLCSSIFREVCENAFSSRPPPKLREPFLMNATITIMYPPHFVLKSLLFLRGWKFRICKFPVSPFSSYSPCSPFSPLKVGFGCRGEVGLGVRVGLGLVVRLGLSLVLGLGLALALALSLALSLGLGLGSSLKVGFGGKGGVGVGVGGRVWGWGWDWG